MAAKRVRDYQAEERRRNEIARAQGFTSRAQKRTVLRKAKEKKIDLPPGILDVTHLRQSASSWSMIHSKVDASRYDPSFSILRTIQYSKAYDVDTADKTKARRKRDLRNYLTDYYQDEYPDATDKEFWNKY